MSESPLKPPLEQLLNQPVTTYSDLKACVDAWESLDCQNDCASPNEKSAYFFTALALTAHCQTLLGIHAGERDTLLFRLWIESWR